MPSCLRSCITSIKTRMSQLGSYRHSQASNYTNEERINSKHQQDMAAMQAETKALREETQVIRRSLSQLESRTATLFAYVELPDQSDLQQVAPCLSSPLEFYPGTNASSTLPREWPRMQKQNI